MAIRATLLPAPIGACGDRADNDGDGAADYPDDPGCADLLDDDETDPPACIDGAILSCGVDTGACRSGLRTCEGSHFGACIGFIRRHRLSHYSGQHQS